MAQLPDELVSLLRHEVYEFYDLDGWTYFYDTTVGQAIAAARGDLDTISLRELGVTIERIRSQYEGMDETYALTTDLTRPVLFIPRGNEVVLVDGWHRLFHAANVGVDTLFAYFLSPEEASSILVMRLPRV